MRNDLFDDIWNEVHGHSEVVDSLLIQSWVRDTWREIAEARTWSWLRRKSLISVPAPYSTGTVAVTPGSPLITFTGATLTQAMVGLQFRSGYVGNIYDVQSVDPVAGTAMLWPPFNDAVGTVVTGLSYKIFTAYIVPPDSDFFSWISVTNPSARRRLLLHVNNQTIDRKDPQRTRVGVTGGPSCLSGIDWSASYAGKVFPTTIISSNSGKFPVSGGSYTGQSESVYIIKVTVQGQVGTAQFTVQKDSNTVSAARLTDAVGNFLGEGVYVTFPTQVTFQASDVFLVRVSPRANAGLPRYELYPHPTQALLLNCTYSMRVHDIDEAGFVMPYTMRGDVVKLGALAKMARRFPGTDQKPNPFAQVARATALEQQFADAVGDLITADDYIMETNVSDDPWDGFEWATLPWATGSGSGRSPVDDYGINSVY